jgi:hypothetical protein
MAQRKTLEQQIASAKLEMEQKENRLKELLGKQKEQDRKERNHRLCKRMGIIEKYMPDTIPLTDEQFIAFIEEAVANDYGKRKLAHIISQGAEKYPPETTEKAPYQEKNNNAKPTGTATPQGSPAPAKPSETPSPQNNIAPAKPAESKPGGNGTSPAAGGNSTAKAG